MAEDLDIQTRIRGILAKRILDVNNGNVVIPELPNKYTISDFEVEETYFPKEDLDKLEVKPKIKLVTIGFSNNRQRILRDKSIEVEVPVQICIQQKVDQTNTSYLDKLVRFFEQVQLTTEDDFAGEPPTIHGYSWLRTELLRDENDLIYTYQDLTIKGVFQAIFTPIYKHLLERSC